MSSVHISHVYVFVFKKMHLEDEQTGFCRKCDENIEGVSVTIALLSQTEEKKNKRKYVCISTQVVTTYVFVIFFPPFKAD